MKLFIIIIIIIIIVIVSFRPRLLVEKTNKQTEIERIRWRRWIGFRRASSGCFTAFSFSLQNLGETQ